MYTTAYAKANGIPVKQTASKPYSYDENMWGNSAEGGVIEQPNEEAPLGDIFQWCNTIEETPNIAQYITIDFEKGTPTAVDGQKMPLAEIIAVCNKAGAKHGVSVTQLIEDRLVGLKVRGIFEQPGASMLIAAHKKLEKLVSTRTENEFKATVDAKWAYQVYGAQWFDPSTHHLMAYIDDQNQKVTGTVTLKLFKGQIIVVSLDSPYSLFSHKLATFEKNGAFNQNASAGFIEIFTMAQQSAYGAYNYED